TSMISTAVNENVIEKDHNQYGIPFVFVDRTNNENEGISTNHFEGGKLQGLVISEGRAQNVLIAHADLKIDAFRLRVDGVKEMLELQGISYLLCEEETLDDEAQFMNLIYQNHIDSIICSNDLMAIKTLGFIQQHGLRVPSDVQIVGYDNIPFSKMTFPQITTIDQSAYRIGEVAVSRLLNLYDEGAKYDVDQVEITVKRRESTRM